MHLFRIVQMIYDYETNVNGNKDFDPTCIVGFKTKDKYYVIDYILIKPD